MQLTLAWRNILRNKRRTIIAGLAIGVGLASMILSDGFMIGLEGLLVRSATATFLGDGQIHGAGFRETLEIDKTINDLDGVLDRLGHDDRVAHAAPRIMALAMISSPSEVQAVTMVAIDPTREQYLSQVDDAIVKGEYFEG